MVLVKKYIDGKARVRHPEKQNNVISPILKKPSWIRVKAPSSKGYFETKKIVKENKLVTVCEEAGCPNVGECWSKGHATMMIMGDICTRSCSFCNVATGKPELLDPFEPLRVAKAVESLKLRHVVITSVDRDDLKDGGANHIAKTVLAVKRKSPGTSVEILTPDFLKTEPGSLQVLIDSKPDVFNHNLETVPSLYPSVRPGARYFNSLKLLDAVKTYDPSIFTKSGLMVGLGETMQELSQVMDDLRSANVDFLTVGQYLQPTPKHFAVSRFVSPEEFNKIEKIAYGKGFLMVSASPLTRSSYHADDDFEQMKKSRSQGLSFGAS